MSYISDQLLEEIVADTLDIDGVTSQQSRDRARAKYLELLPILDKDGHQIEVAPRGLAHRLGLWHPTVFVMVVDPAGNLLLQVRGKDASSSNRLDVAVGGHVRAGEQDYAKVALRETREELNLDVSVDRLLYVSSHNRTTPLRPHRPLERNREHRVVYELLLTYDEKEALRDAFRSREDSGEVDGLIWCTRSEAISAIHEDRCADGLKSVLNAWLSEKGFEPPLSNEV